MTDDQAAFERIRIALQSPKPSNALIELAKEFKSEGAKQERIYQRFNAFRAMHEAESDEARYNAILDAMDVIVGWCSPSKQLFDD